eukprot:2403815-Pyramimonas_sp.AAC.1
MPAAGACVKLQTGPRHFHGGPVGPNRVPLSPSLTSPRTEASGRRKSARVHSALASESARAVPR